MSILGELFGYDSRGNDIAGNPEDVSNACVACGVACNAHTPEMEAECLRRIYGTREAGESKS
jgi:hypothetical protein